MYLTLSSSIIFLFLFLLFLCSDFDFSFGGSFFCVQFFSFPPVSPSLLSLSFNPLFLFPSIHISLFPLLHPPCHLFIIHLPLFSSSTFPLSLPPSLILAPSEEWLGISWEAWPFSPPSHGPFQNTRPESSHVLGNVFSPIVFFCLVYLISYPFLSLYFPFYCFFVFSWFSWLSFSLFFAIATF